MPHPPPQKPGVYLRGAHTHAMAAQQAGAMAGGSRWVVGTAGWWAGLDGNGYDMAVQQAGAMAGGSRWVVGTAYGSVRLVRGQGSMEAGMTWRRSRQGPWRAGQGGWSGVGACSKVYRGQGWCCVAKAGWGRGGRVKVGRGYGVRVCTAGTRAALDGSGYNVESGR